ncbi:MAG: ABC transporter substrate-binding protein, partial [Gammaproteobacteria bacterium]|nr:ABC transporter substrate-binding protein [Gammaproteobacteria bacterium]
MKKNRLLAFSLGTIALLFGHSSFAMDCEELVLGAAISLTGKYATNGVHAQNGYEFAIQKIAENGGVKIGDKCYNFRVIYYDDESKGDRGATLAERLINQ